MCLKLRCHYPRRCRLASREVRGIHKGERGTAKLPQEQLPQALKQVRTFPPSSPSSIFSFFFGLSKMVTLMDQKRNSSALGVGREEALKETCA